jgi:hypothetical protein
MASGGMDGCPWDTTKPTTVFTCAASALWALCGLIMFNCERQFAAANNGQLLHDLKKLMGMVSSCSAEDEEVVCAAAWIVFVISDVKTEADAGSDGPAHQLRLRTQNRLVFDADMFPALLCVLECPWPSACGLAAWAIRGLVHENSACQVHALHVAVPPALGKVMRRMTVASAHAAVCANVQASAVWAIGALCYMQPIVQDSLRSDGDGGVLRDIVASLASPCHNVLLRTTTALHMACFRNSDNQSFVVSIGGLQRLCHLLHIALDQAWVRVQDKIFSCLLVLTIKHAAGSAMLRGNMQLFSDICSCLSMHSTKPVVAGLAAGLTRVLCTPPVPGTVDQDAATAESVFVGMGAVYHLSVMCACKDEFAQEQACTALFNIVRGSVFHQNLLIAVEGHRFLCALVAKAGTPVDADAPRKVIAGGGGQPSELSVFSALLCLRVLTSSSSECLQYLRSVEVFLDSLHRLGHVSNPVSRVQGAASALLLRLVGPASEDAAGMQPALQALNERSVKALVDVLGVVRGGGCGASAASAGGCGASAASARDTANFFCSICCAGSGSSAGCSLGSAGDSLSSAGGSATVGALASTDSCGDVKDAVFLPCFHYYHKDCILQWLLTGRDQCPMCSTPVLVNIQKLLGTVKSKSRIVVL